MDYEGNAYMHKTLKGIHEVVVGKQKYKYGSIPILSGGRYQNLPQDNVGS